MKVAVVGCGNMGSAIIKGITGGLCASSDVVGSDPDSEKLKTLSCRTTDSNRDAVSSSDVVILAVKPQIMDGVLEEIKEDVRDRLIISVAAGIRCERIERALGKVRVIRVMPNTPALIGCGISGLCKGRWAEDKDLVTAKRIFGAVGDVVEVKEELMDAVCAVSGSGPAYIFLVAEALIAAGVRMGLTQGLARRLVLSTIKGSVELADKSQKHLAELRDSVTSPGGVTSSALEVMERRGLRGILIEALLSAERRAKELSR
jgi:pyrroline-5-carboxylate reductase